MTEAQILALIQDEKARQQVAEALKNEWLPKGDFTKAQQAKADELKAIQEKNVAMETENKRFMEWYYGTYEPWKQQVTPILQRYGNANQNPNPGNPASGQPQGGQNWYENWDVLTPQQQAQALQQQQIAYTNQLAQNFGQQFNQSIQAMNSAFDQRWAVYIDAIERGRKNPDLDIQPLLEKAKQYKVGEFNPLDLAQRELLADKEKEKWLQQGRDLGKQDAETEFKAKRSPVDSSSFGDGPEPFKPAIVKKEDRMAELKTKVGEKFGPQVWRP